MIAKLRRRHYRAWLALVVVLAAVLLAAWSARRPVPTMERLPAVLLEKNAAP